MKWYEQLGYEYPSEYFMDEVRFPDAKNLQNPVLVAIALDAMCDGDGIPRTKTLRCCRSCGRMTTSEHTCTECGSPV